MVRRESSEATAASAAGLSSPDR
ncbi:hypothetical protein AB0I38_35010 [Nonomuraea cavernae]